MNLLIPYVHIPGHNDPDFAEFTYGDIGPRARTLLTLNRGDVIFFHTAINHRKFITAYYVVDRTLRSQEAASQPLVVAKYHNPHIRDHVTAPRSLRADRDAVVFGDPILSRSLAPPLPFDKRLASRLSLQIKFPAGRSDVTVIGSATRSWRHLTNRDVRTIFAAICAWSSKSQPLDIVRSTEEVAEVIEKDIEDHVAKHPELLGRGLTLDQRQVPIPSGRIDLLLKDRYGNEVVVEVKQHRIGREALHQLHSYIAEVRKNTSAHVTGILLCSGVMPAFERDIRAAKNVRVAVYGWRLEVQPW